MAVSLNAKGCPLQGQNNLDQLKSSLSFFVVKFNFQSQKKTSLK